MNCIIVSELSPPISIGGSSVSIDKVADCVDGLIVKLEKPSFNTSNVDASTLIGDVDNSPVVFISHSDGVTVTVRISSGSIVPVNVNGTIVSLATFNSTSSSIDKFNLVFGAGFIVVNVNICGASVPPVLTVINTFVSEVAMILIFVNSLFISFKELTTFEYALLFVYSMESFTLNLQFVGVIVTVRISSGSIVPVNENEV